MTETEDAKIVNIEYKIQDVESKINHFESDVDEAKDGIKKLNEDLNIWRLFNERMIPYVYEKTLSKLLKKLEEDDYTEAVINFQKNSFLFNWDDFSENDNNRFIVNLAKKYNINGLKKSQIEKDENTIKICFENNSIILRLHEEGEKIFLKINNDNADDLILKRENGKINIYKTLDRPSPLNGRNVNKERILLCTTYLKNAKEFFEAGKIASYDTKPIFYYYSITNLFSFLLNSLVYFDNPKAHHGIYLIRTENIKEDIRFRYNKYGGLFERVVHTLSMFDYPSTFSSFIPYRNKKETILFPQKTDVSISNTNSILLDELFKPDFQKKDLQKLYFELDLKNIGSQRYVKTSTVLRDFISIFVSCSIARYNPVLWRNIYSGESSDLIFHFEESFNNISEMIRLVNDIIRQGEEGQLIVNFRKSWAAADFFV